MTAASALTLSACDPGGDGGSRDGCRPERSGYYGDGGGYGSDDLQVVGLTADNRLICFSEDSPGYARNIGTVRGLTGGDTRLVGFDIYSTVRNGSTIDVQGLASLTVGGRASLYEITLFTGRASVQGTFSDANQVVGIAIPLNQL